MLGLPRGEVEVVKYQKTWLNDFITEKELIRNLKNIHIKSIEHIGSTSIPNMPAKPILDLMVGVDIFYNASKVVRDLEKIGYIWKKDVAKRYEWLFVKGDDDCQTHYLKVLKYNGTKWKRYITFREYLKKNQVAFEKYKNLKLQLVQGNKINSRKDYTIGKSAFIKTIEK